MACRILFSPRLNVGRFGNPFNVCFINRSLNVVAVRLLLFCTRLFDIFYSPSFFFNSFSYFFSCISNPRFGQTSGLALRTKAIAYLNPHPFFFIKYAMTNVADYISPLLLWISQPHSAPVPLPSSNYSLSSRNYLQKTSRSPQFWNLKEDRRCA